MNRKEEVNKEAGKYAMWNRINDWIIYDKDFNRLYNQSKKPTGLIFVSPIEVYRQTNGTMGIEEA